MHKEVRSSTHITHTKKLPVTKKLSVILLNFNFGMYVILETVLAHCVIFNFVHCIYVYLCSFLISQW